MPLNDPLFAVLQRQDPGACVVSEGQPGEFYLPAKDIGYSRKGSIYAMVRRWGECYRMNCPICGDEGRHLYFCHLAGATVLTKEYKAPLQFSDRICVCHRRHCERENPNFKLWLKGLGIWNLGMIDLSDGSLKKSTDKYGFCSDFEDRLPNPTFPLTSGSTPQYVRDWLVDSRRQDPIALQNTYAVGYAPAGAKFKDNKAVSEEAKTKRLQDDRLIVPVLQGRTLVGWQGRLIRDELAKGDIKYYNSPNMEKSRVLYNLDRAMRYSVVVLVEGVFDVWRIGDLAVCMFGHSLSPHQKLQLKAVYGRNGGGIIMLDAEAEEGKNIVEIARNMANELRLEQTFPRGVVPVTITDGKDPDDRSVYELERILAAASSYLEPIHSVTVDEEDMLNITMGFDELEEAV